MPTARRSLVSRGSGTPYGYPLTVKENLRRPDQCNEKAGSLHCAPSLSKASFRCVLRGLALEVRDLVGLRIGPVLRVRELVLGLALALLLSALALQAAVTGE